MSVCPEEPEAPAVWVRGGSVWSFWWWESWFRYLWGRRWWGANNPKGRYIEFDINIDEEYDAYYDSIFDAVTSDNEIIIICAVGLDDNDHLIFKAESYNDDKWFFEELSNPPYAEIYWFVAQNLQYAKKEPLDKEDE